MSAVAKRLLVMAGGTGGHIMPALAVADFLRGEGWEVEWLGTRGGMEERLAKQYNYRLHVLDFAGVVGKSLVAKALMPLRLLRAMWQARSIMQSFKPSVVFGLGGFPALPGGLWASFAKIPLVIHEQNAVAGKTNVVLAPRATKILLGFAGALPNVKTPREVVGVPVRESIHAIANARDNRMDASLDARSSTSALRIAVVGGSLGAQVLNETVPRALALMPPDRRPHIVHQTGKSKAAEVLAAYRSRVIEADVREFIDDMAALYRDVDLVVCRSGATTVSELAAAGVPAILVPYPFHADQQQLHNARFLADQGAALLIEQKDLTADLLAAKLLALTRPQLNTMSRIAQSLAPKDTVPRIAAALAAAASEGRQA